MEKIKNPTVGQALESIRGRALYCGIDQSLTHPSIALLNSEGPLLLLDMIPPKGQDHGVERLAYFYNQFEALFTFPFITVAMEGYSFGSKYSREVLGELGAVIKLAAYRSRKPTIVVPPTSLKKFVTGKGNAAKDIMVKEVFKRWSIDCENDNDADAVGLVYMAKAYSGDLSTLLTCFQLEALAVAERLFMAEPRVRRRNK